MLLSPTVQRDKEADGVLGDPLADAVARALLDAGDEGSVVDDAVEYFALGRLGRAHGQIGLAGPRRKGAATHGWGRALSAMGCFVAAMEDVVECGRRRGGILLLLDRNHGSGLRWYYGRLCWVSQQSIRSGAMFQGERIVFALGCGGAEASESGWIMTLRIIVVGVTVAVGQVKLGPAAPRDDEVLTPSGGTPHSHMNFTLLNAIQWQGSHIPHSILRLWIPFVAFLEAYRGERQ
jgi:hypothetical protein